MDKDDHVLGLLLALASVGAFYSFVKWLWRPPVKREQRADAYYLAELTERERNLILELLEDKAARTHLRLGAIEALELAMLVDLPLVRGKVNWAEAEKLARERGSSLADLIYDRGGKGE